MSGRQRELAILVIQAAIEAAEKLQQLARDNRPDDGADLLASAWHHHCNDYERVLKARGPVAEQLTLERMGEMIALPVLGEYFKCRGDWTQMVRNLRARLESIPTVFAEDE